VLAYKDPLGVTAPRIKVQVKHRRQKLAVRKLRELEALLREEGDIGLIVSSGCTLKRPCGGLNFRVRCVPLEKLFEFRRRFDLVLHNHVIEVASQIRKNASIPEIPCSGNFFQVSCHLPACPGLAMKVLRTTIMRQISSRNKWYLNIRLTADQRV
jgi:hypothetical protein